MTTNLSKCIPTFRTSEKIAPESINHAQLLNIATKISTTLASLLPKKRSGFSYESIIYVELYAQLTGLSIKDASQNLQAIWRGYEHRFQSFRIQKFSNGKQRRAIPDQPTISRFINKIALLKISEDFINMILWAQLLYVLNCALIDSEIILIADYHDEPCKTNPHDPYCFGTKTGKDVHRNLVFSIHSRNIHLIVACYKIKKNEHKLPFFERMIHQFQMNHISIKYMVLDRGFYRKELLQRLKELQINVIIPGRKCMETHKKIVLWLHDKGGRRGKFRLPVRYVRHIGWIHLSMDFILYGKKGYRLSEVKQDVKKGVISEAVAVKRVFPLLFMRGNQKGVLRSAGSEAYIREIYRKRWSIEIAFRSLNGIGLKRRGCNRDIGLFRFGSKCFIYNGWQISRVLQSKEDPYSDPLSLKEFCGRLSRNRSKWI